ncbi:MAG: hypothetical protein QOD49_3057 [Actinomycetota bacterium]|nr:hypothetical protein [Actinomycetota bacterium]
MCSSRRQEVPGRSPRSWPTSKSQIDALDQALEHLEALLLPRQGQVRLPCQASCLVQDPDFLDTEAFRCWLSGEGQHEVSDDRQAQDAQGNPFLRRAIVRRARVTATVHVIVPGQHPGVPGQEKH